ncbi:carboxymuconolactone decarboxylase family protein [Yinghuangia soli]|uniref:Peroxidase-related enzyme n=1 Tax=Yinghuangia soli TaxID=2908204 RepID=A0AA41Q2Y4_9ACTN|nr:peroxidase-related enzyme [Yinghuangia soli]MCF2530588.1 peroxidase-related enzyme [Yinghuangia soli]
MAHIDLGNQAPGIAALFAYRPETAAPINQLVETLLRGPGTLAPGERELIAAYVSELNDCQVCAPGHSAIAAVQLPGGADLVAQVKADPDRADITPKLRALLHIAALVRESGSAVAAKDIDAAREAGADDREIHDAVLIAAAFSMINRYADALGAAPITDPGMLAGLARRITARGYTG